MLHVPRVSQSVFWRQRSFCSHKMVRSVPFCVSFTTKSLTVYVDSLVFFIENVFYEPHALLYYGVILPIRDGNRSLVNACLMRVCESYLE